MNYFFKTFNMEQNHFVANRLNIMSYLVFCGLLPTCLSVFFFYILNSPTFLRCGFGRAVYVCV